MSNALRKPNNRYSEAAKELDYRRYIRENLSAAERMNYAIQEFAPPIIGGAGIITLAAPGLLEVCAGVACTAAAAYAMTKQAHPWPLCTPAFVSKASPMHRKLFKLKSVPVLGSLINLKDPKDMHGDGIMLLGADMDNEGAQIWTSMDLMVRHMLLIGTTGSGKTQAILGMIAQLMAQGSGGIFCDGKADITTWFMLYTLARHYGLERQLLVINYLTSGKPGTKRSNTTNIFEIASADSLSEMTSSMMGGGGGGGNEDMWRGRAEALFGVIIRAATEDRDQRGETIVPDDLRRRMTLQMLLELPSNMKYSQRVRDEAQLFLNDLPGYSAWQKSSQPQQKEQAVGRMSEQLGFLQMQFTRVLSLLSGTYGYITGTDISEIDWIDVINQRRTVYIMLPALEKSPESLKQLGRMVVTSMRNAMLPIIGGGQLTGSKKILIDGRPIGKKIPYGLFLDEYGSYCVEGFGDVVAQIRSMGVFACFSGQDWASFKKGSEIEASRVNANTGTKIFLKSFDPDTVKLLVEICGKKLVSVASSWADKPSGARPDVSTKFQSVENLSVQEVDRVRIELLAQQDPGMAHIYFGGKLWNKVKMFYPDIKQSTFSQVNSFVRMRTPIGLSGILEEAERAMVMKNRIEQIGKSLADFKGITQGEPNAGKQLEFAEGFYQWSGATETLMRAKGAELFSSMQQAAKTVFAPGAPAAAPVEAGARKQGGALGAVNRYQAQPSAAQAEKRLTSEDRVDDNDREAGLPPLEIPSGMPPAPAKAANLPQEESPFSMDHDVMDLDTQSMIIRTTGSQALIAGVKEQQKSVSGDAWAATPAEARAGVNAAVSKAMPNDPNNGYPASPVPATPANYQEILGDIAKLRSRLQGRDTEATAEANTTTEGGEGA